jgi:hypothetical protein
MRDVDSHQRIRRAADILMDVRRRRLMMHPKKTSWDGPANVIRSNFGDHLIVMTAGPSITAITRQYPLQSGDRRRGPF